ncbi:hypothetical protein AUR64_03010 [Haloprofundus marisrubri]|uniref:DUF3017 domain-containing protein n=1 Tax=Haloprofundus marisrubri TaxID=1514971 RepID=A0A0W1R355_9EURY|nr:hypothetical protein [Haloprofundus marisrubri]KTG07643.1 hypothetical protein AUR64_03010 [Haloprofundus marisrubri]
MNVDTNYGQWQRRSDTAIAVGAVLVGLWLLFSAEFVSAVALFTFGAIGIARFVSPVFRSWTDDNQFAFLFVLSLLSCVAVAGVYPFSSL